MTVIINHKAYLDELIAALGYDPEKIQTDEDFDKLVAGAEALNRIRVAYITSQPEKTGAIFICGRSVSQNKTGFPNGLSVCIEFGSNVIAQYVLQDTQVEEGS